MRVMGNPWKSPQSLFLSLAISVWGSLGLAACGDEESAEPACGDGIVQPERGEQCDDGPLNSDRGPCRVDCKLASNCALQEDLACHNVECGEIQAVDSCGHIKAISCGPCADESEHCYANRCVTGCDLSEEDVAALCHNKCGVIEAPNACGQKKSFDCGRDCGDAMTCHLVENICVRPSQCQIDTAPYCAQSRCGAASAIDDCGEKILFDCAGTEGVAVADPLQDLSTVDGWFVGPEALWDASGAYRVGMIEQGEVLMYLLYDATLGEGDTGRLSEVTTVGGRLDTCETAFCAFIVKQSEALEYWYDSISGTATILSLEPLRIEFKDVYFSEYVDSYFGSACLTSPVDFNYASGVICNPNGIDALNQNCFGESENGHAYQALMHYEVSEQAFDYDQVVYYYSAEDVFIYAEVNNFWRDLAELAAGIPLDTPLAFDTQGGFTDDGYAYCYSQSCLMIYTGAQYNAFEGTIEFTKRDSQEGVAGSVANARFYMAESTTVAPMECLTPAIGFSFETSPGTYTNDQGQQRPYFADYSESHSWKAACAQSALPTLDASAQLTGKARVLALSDEEGYSELEFWSEEIDPSKGQLIVNINTYFNKAPPFVKGVLETFENFQLHPLSSAWVIQNNTAYCYSPLCIGYVHEATLLSPVAGNVSITSIESNLSGSADGLVFTGSEAHDESGNPLVCLHAPLSFSFSGAIEPEMPNAQ